MKLDSKVPVRLAIPVSMVSLICKMAMASSMCNNAKNRIIADTISALQFDQNMQLYQLINWDFRGKKHGFS